MKNNFFVDCSVDCVDSANYISYKTVLLIVLYI